MIDAKSLIFQGTIGIFSLNRYVFSSNFRWRKRTGAKRNLSLRTYPCKANEKGTSFERLSQFSLVLLSSRYPSIFYPAVNRADFGQIFTIFINIFIICTNFHYFHKYLHTLDKFSLFHEYLHTLDKFSLFS